MSIRALQIILSQIILPDVAICSISVYGKTKEADTLENHIVEWKESWRDEYLQGICGFANAQRGILEIGRNDKGEIVGISNAAKLLEELPNKIRTTMGIVADVNHLDESGKEYIYFENDAEILYQDEINGLLISIVDRVMDTIFIKYFKGLIHYEGLQRVDHYPMPREVLREAIYNAVVHKDYSSGEASRTFSTNTSNDPCSSTSPEISLLVATQTQASSSQNIEILQLTKSPLLLDHYGKANGFIYLQSASRIVQCELRHFRFCTQFCSFCLYLCSNTLKGFLEVVLGFLIVHLN